MFHAVGAENLKDLLPNFLIKFRLKGQQIRKYPQNKDYDFKMSSLKKKISQLEVCQEGFK